MSALFARDVVRVSTSAARKFRDEPVGTAGAGSMLTGPVFGEQDELMPEQLPHLIGFKDVPHLPAFAFVDGQGQLGLFGKRMFAS
jgi:hypothetical protein